MGEAVAVIVAAPEAIVEADHTQLMTRGHSTRRRGRTPRKKARRRIRKALRRPIKTTNGENSRRRTRSPSITSTTTGRDPRLRGRL